MIWEKVLPDGTKLEVKNAYLPLKGYREEREYMVLGTPPGLGRVSVCMLAESGQVKRWFSAPFDRAAVQEALQDIPNFLLVETVSNN